MKKKDRHHLHLLCDISELASLLIGSQNIENFLQRTVEMVARHLEADVSSIYLFDEKSEELVLKATIGLNPHAIDQICMKIGEGLVGTTLEKLEAVIEGHASRHPKFKYFKEAGEEPFESFLAVPILRGVEKIGVLVVRHEKRNYFDDIDVMAMRAIASQLAGAIGHARLLIDNKRYREKRSEDYYIPKHLRFFKGEVASPGYAFAQATVYDKSQGAWFALEVDDSSEYSLADFRTALQATTDQLKDLQYRFAQRLPESASLIFSAHLMILKDIRFSSKIEELIKGGTPPPIAIKDVATHYIDLFSSSPFAHIREKANDVQDLAGRLLRNLEHRVQDDPFLRANRIVIAAELYPSTVLRLASEDIQGVILVSGGVTSHVSILAQSLQIPLIIANDPELLHLPEGTPVIMDAENGNICIQPSNELINQFKSEKKVIGEREVLAEQMTPMTFTKDDVQIHLLANINLLNDLKLARKFNAEGVGLYRTEFPFLLRSALPSEEEQYQVYKQVFDEMDGKNVTIRTLDLGGDKLLAYSDTSGEPNPNLGLRAIRFSFRHRDIFFQQLRAILRAGAGAEGIRIMFPMISSLDEFRVAKQTVYDCMRELKHEKLYYHQNALIGVLVELPCLVEIINELAAEADFLSIGTNDFVQYLLAVDRANENVAQYYQPFHPAVLRSLAKIVKAVKDSDKEVSVCGELAHEPEYIPFLLGIGIRNLSVYPRFLPFVQNLINGLKISVSEVYAKRLLAETTIDGVRRALKSLSSVSQTEPSHSK